VAVDESSPAFEEDKESVAGAGASLSSKEEVSSDGSSVEVEVELRSVNGTISTAALIFSTSYAVSARCLFICSLKLESELSFAPIVDIGKDTG